MTSFSRSFLDDSISTIAAFDDAEIERMVEVIRETRERGGRLFLCGSGGGAGHASHAACDFRKLVRIESYAVTDNVSELTARINDDGWDSSYSEWLRVLRPAGSKSGAPPSWTMRSAIWSAWPCSSWECFRNSSATAVA